MPKVSNTRKQKAAKLLEVVKDGPASGVNDDPTVLSLPREAYQLWVNTWVSPALRELVPELRKP